MLKWYFQVFLMESYQSHAFLAIACSALHPPDQNCGLIPQRSAQAADIETLM